MAFLLPDAPWHNTALHSERDWKKALEQVQSLQLPPHPDPYKNWDHLAALDSILKHSDTSAHVLDAGADLNSVILPWLALYGYKHLIGINPIFDAPIIYGPIRYFKGDITHTDFKPHSLDMITCMSVIEHGVDSSSYFHEAARILKPGGLLITSVDYYPEPVSTQGKSAYSVPIHIFCRAEILDMLQIAEQNGFVQTGPIDLESEEKPISWMGLQFTFLIFTLQKR
jgi:SAM-dependent methyltransferase